MRVDVAAAPAAHNLPAPLQADLARHRLAGELPGAGNLEVEGVERMERAPMLRWSKERGEKAILVALAQQRLAVIKRIRHAGKVAGFSVHRDQARRDAATLAQQ